jgi:hypothetical protein
VRDHVSYRKKRSLAPVLILQRLAAAEITDTLHLQDFRSPAIFEFFNTIGAKRTFAKPRTSPKCQKQSWRWAASPVL